MTKQNYKFQGKDFIPMKGLFDYNDRNSSYENTNSEFRRAFLIGYNSFLIVAPIGFAILGAIKGIEALVK